MKSDGDLQGERSLPWLKGGGPTIGWWRGSVRDRELRVFCAFVRGRIPQSRLRRAGPL